MRGSKRTAVHVPKAVFD